MRVLLMMKSFYIQKDKKRQKPEKKTWKRLNRHFTKKKANEDMLNINDNYINAN